MPHLPVTDRQVYGALRRLLCQRPGDVLIGDICESFSPPLPGAMAWAFAAHLN